jgi:hypothetical protein
MKRSRKIYAKGLGGPYIHIKRPLTKNKKVLLHSVIEKSLSKEIESRFCGQVSVHIEIVEGSIKAKVVIGAVVLFEIVGNYGSLRSGVDHIVNDIQNLSSTVIEHVIEEENIEENEIIYKARRLGIPGKIQRYLIKLDRFDDTDVNLVQRSELIDDLRADLTDILTVLEHEQDRELVLGETPVVVKEEVAQNLPTPIPGQLDLRYEYTPNYPFDQYEDPPEEQPTLPDSPTWNRPELPPPRNEDE